MKAECDRIIFESRKEIESTQKALEKYLESNNDDNVKRLNDLLEIMSMNW